MWYSELVNLMTNNALTTKTEGYRKIGKNICGVMQKAKLSTILTLI